MYSLRRLAVFSLGVATLSLSTACRKEPPAPVVPAVDSAAIRAEAARRAQEEADRLARLRQDSIDAANRARAARQQQIADSIAAAQRMAEAAARDAESIRAILTTTVNYDFDKAELRDDTRQALDQKIPLLNANPGVMIRIAGHTDARGSGEYNLQLGQRRAAAARDYLQARGIAASRIELVSYGEERPVCQTNDEGCWSQNRRAEFEITAGGSGQLRRP
jgi:peptidoglycan-associated lipoprotein